jgi:predicted acylesterase/phospholipase RssA
MDGHQLVDGGIMNPIPVAEARTLFPEGPVVAVVLSPPLGWQSDSSIESPGNFPLLMTNIPLVYRLAGRLRLAQAFNIFIHSMDLTGQMLMDKQLKLERPEVIIRPKLASIGIVDRVDTPEVIKMGELATLRQYQIFIRRSAGGIK